MNDGSRDEQRPGAARAGADYPFLRVVTHRRQRGIADALRSAGDVARGDIFVFYPADLQYLPEDIPALVAPILEGRADIVTGTKQGKYEKAFVSQRLQRAVPLALRRAGHRSQFGQGLPPRGHAGGAAPAGLAPLHGRDRRGRRLPPHLAAGAAVSPAGRHLEVQLAADSRSACSI